MNSYWVTSAVKGLSRWEPTVLVVVVAQEIDDSVDRIVAGMEGTPMTDGKSKSLVAYHEVSTTPRLVALHLQHTACRIDIVYNQ